eukprot:SAG25_NODE_10_length_28450_cov_12.738775_1_plen_63_part_00
MQMTHTIQLVSRSPSRMSFDWMLYKHTREPVETRAVVEVKYLQECCTKCLESVARRTLEQMK